MNRRVEGDGRPSPEDRNIRVADPMDLMRKNPAALIVNQISYGQMVAHFSPIQFEPPQVVKVITFSPEQGVVTIDCILDGMTRTKVVADNKDNPAVIPHNFQFTVKDVTGEVLQNPAIVPVGERVGRQEALTMLQYLRAVINPTIVHSQIAPDRIAAHLVNGWVNMVGESIARKYSALSALSLLGNPRINIATEDGLKKDLERQPRLMAGETLEERVKLRASLVEMAAVIRQTGLVRQEVARSAFILVGTDSDVIGGAKEARRQIYGLLHTPEVDRKLEVAFSNDSEREQMRDQLGQFISDSFRKVATNYNRDEVMTVLGMALRDQNLNFAQVIGVFSDLDPIKQYDKVREDLNVDRLTKRYKEAQKVQELTKLEAVLVEGLGRKTILSDPDIQNLIRTIRASGTVYQRAELIKSQLTTNRHQLIASGVRAQTVDESLSTIELVQKEMTEINTSESLAKVNQKLISAMDEINRRMNTQVSMHKVGEMIDQTSGDRLKAGYGPQVKADIVGLVVGEFRNIDNNNQSQVRVRVRQLLSLDPDLVFKVKAGEVRLSVALDQQNKRGIIVVQPAIQQVVTPSESAVEKKGAEVAPGFENPRFSGRTYGAPRLVEQARPEEAIIDPTMLNEQRKITNREKLRRLLQNIVSGLRDVDLEPKDITETERTALDEVIRRLGQLDFDHPDTPRVMRSHFQDLEEINRLREELIARDREATDSDTRTGR